MCEDSKKKSEVVSLWIAGIGLLLTGAGAGFAGYQTYQINQSLRTPYLTNLQDRQIDACSGYLQASFSFTVEFDGNDWLKTGFVTMQSVPDVSNEKIERLGSILDTAYWWNFETGFGGTDKILGLTSAAGGDVDALSQATGQLSVFVNEETRKELELVISNLRMSNAQITSAFALFGPPDGETDEEKQKRDNQRNNLYEKAEEARGAAVGGIKQIQDKCRNVMIGEETGLF